MAIDGDLASLLASTALTIGLVAVLVLTCRSARCCADDTRRRAWFDSSLGSSSSSGSLSSEWRTPSPPLVPAPHPSPVRVDHWHSVLCEQPGQDVCLAVREPGRDLPV